MSTESELPVYIGKDAVSQLIRFCEAHHLSRFMVVADQNTYPALGEMVASRLRQGGFDVSTVVLSGAEVVADEHYLVQVLLQADREDRVYLAVGSGTITDITRFISHRTKASFISLPTAPSVDGFTSIGAPLVIAGRKRTVIAQPPIAVFADLDTLCAAPQRMIAAGFGDMLGKYTSLADWKLGHLLWGEPYSEPIAQRMRAAAQHCAQHAHEIGRASEEGVRRLMESLIESGLGMLAFGGSHPASGAEHHLSHFWEMKLLQENRPAILHGAKVGVATILVAGYYERIRQLSRQQVMERLKSATLPDRKQEIERISTAYGPIAEQIIELQAPFLNLDADTFGRLKQRVAEQWPAIQEIAATVPPPRELTELLCAAGGPTDAPSLGLSEQEVALAVQHAHYFRNRFTVMKLCYLLGIPA